MGAEQKRKEMDGRMSQPEGRAQQDHDLQLKLALERFTLVIELDAWNIRERDAWGQSEALRLSGEEPCCHFALPPSAWPRGSNPSARSDQT